MAQYLDAPTTPDRIGILVTNLGTPAAPTASALRTYLREFLSDPRVVELPRPLWWLILNGIILNVRPRRSAELYRRIWTPEGSPLLAIARRQAEALRRALRERLGGAFSLALGMRYGQPSIAGALEDLRRDGCTRLLVLPLFPQYAAATVGSTFDAVAQSLRRWRRTPELRTIADYHADPGYIAALAASAREFWAREGEPQRLLISMHGIPMRYDAAGDPYRRQCEATAAALARSLALPPDRWQLVYQSRFGKEDWLQPYIIPTLESLPKAGVVDVDVICPGFSADCLETLEEIAATDRELFLRAGGRRYRYIPALNDRPDHIAALAALINRHLHGWIAD